MSEFKNVAIVKNANIYFDGNVSSRTVIFSDGSEKTLGLMLPGEYEFNTGKKEIMEIYTGALEYQIVGQQQWSSIHGGESFEVPENSTFKIKINTITDYCCSFVD